MTYGDLFVSVRQRSVAFRYYLDFYATVSYGASSERDYLDAAYRFLNTEATEPPLRYFAKRDGYAYADYMAMLTAENGCAKPVVMVHSSHEKEGKEAQEA